MSKVGETDVTNCIYYFIDDIVNIENLDANNIKIEEKSNKIFLSTKLVMWHQTV